MSEQAKTRKRKTKTATEAIKALKDAKGLANKVIDAINNLEMELEDIQSDISEAMQRAESAVDYVTEKIEELEKQ